MAVKEGETLRLSDPSLAEEKIVVRNSSLAVTQRVEDLDGDLIITQKGIV